MFVFLNVSVDLFSQDSFVELFELIYPQLIDFEHFDATKIDSLLLEHSSFRPFLPLSFSFISTTVAELAFLQSYASGRFDNFLLCDDFLPTLLLNCDPSLYATIEKYRANNGTLSALSYFNLNRHLCEFFEKNLLKPTKNVALNDQLLMIDQFCLKIANLHSETNRNKLFRWLEEFFLQQDVSQAILQSFWQSVHEMIQFFKQFPLFSVENVALVLQMLEKWLEFNNDKMFLMEQFFPTTHQLMIGKLNKTRVYEKWKEINRGKIEIFFKIKYFFNRFPCFF